METVVIGYQPQPDKLCELLLLTITNGILQQLTSVSHGFCVFLSVGSGSRPSQSSDHRSGKGSTSTQNVKENSDGCYT
jgi:hypothetical protein